MTFTYDKEADALYIKLTEQPIADSEEVEPHVVVDYDENEQIVGIEILYFVKKHGREFVHAFSGIMNKIKGNSKKDTGTLKAPFNIPNQPVKPSRISRHKQKE